MVLLKVANWLARAILFLLFGIIIWPAMLAFWLDDETDGNYHDLFFLIGFAGSLVWCFGCISLALYFGSLTVTHAL